MKANKTPGVSKISVELLKSMALHEEGLQSLKHVLDDILQDPLLLMQQDLLTGWVILLPKKLQVLDAAMLRPIVLGEVLVATWPTPKSCFGSVQGRGVADAAFLTSVAVREAVIMGAPVVAVKLDISGAYDSLRISAVLQWLAKRWSSSTGKSAKVIQHILSHSTLVFHLFEQEWTQAHCVGTQQGATHSPVLFGYPV